MICPHKGHSVLCRRHGSPVSAPGRPPWLGHCLTARSRPAPDNITGTVGLCAPVGSSYLGQAGGGLRPGRQAGSDSVKTSMNRECLGNPEGSCLPPVSSRCFLRRPFDHCHQTQQREGLRARRFNRQPPWVSVCFYSQLDAGQPARSGTSPRPWGPLCVTHHRPAVFQTRVVLPATSPSEANIWVCASEHESDGSSKINLSALSPGPPPRTLIWMGGSCRGWSPPWE